METRVKTRIWVQAFLRRVEADGFMAAVLARGDEDAGAVVIKVNRFGSGCRVYSQARDETGRLVWLCGTGDAAVEEEDADAYVARQQTYDADLWIVEVEDPKGLYEIDGPVLKT